MSYNSSNFLISSGFTQCADGSWRKLKPGEKRPTIEPEDTPEKQIQQEIEDWLKENERSLGIMWTRNRTDKRTSCEVGRPDFVGSYQGKAWAIEIKKPGSKATIEQQGELLRWKLSGAVSGIATSLKSFRTLLGIS